MIKLIGNNTCINNNYNIKILLNNNQPLIINSKLKKDNIMKNPVSIFLLKIKNFMLKMIQIYIK